MKQNESLVLVVDDITSNIEFISDILSTIPDIKIEGINSGEEALASVKKTKPDLILLDISMPKMDGIEVCTRLKSDPAYESIPVIFLTAKIQKEDIVKGFEVGAVDYIAKPFNMSELLSRVKTHLDLNRKSKELIELNASLEGLVQERTRQLIETNKNLTDTNRKLTDAYEALASLDNAKNDFISHINHELRTPLNGILGYTSLLEDQLNGESKTYLQSINDLVARLIKVAEISLLLTELKTINYEITIHEVLLADIIKNAMPEEEMSKKNIHPSILLSNGSQTVLGEHRLLSTCLAIIFDNAIKYSPVNGNVYVTGKDNNNFYSLEIIDEGPGFSPTALSSLFQLFTADNLEYHSHGFGIGLTTAKKIVDLLGGKINIRNKEKGASVVLHLKKPGLK